LNDLNTLWLQRCGLIDLDGISCFNSLKELYLAYNEIDDLSSLSMLENLSCLDLEGNNVDDIAQVEFLGLCSNLVSLSLSGNPVELAPHPDTSEKDLKFYDYRLAIAKAVPQLRVLDDEPFLYDIIDGKSVIRSTSSKNQEKEQDFKEDIFLVQESLKALSVIEEDEDDDQEGSGYKRPDSALHQDRLRPFSGRSRPSSGRSRPVSSRCRPFSSRDRPTSSLAQRNRSLLIEDRPNSSYATDTSLGRPESVRSGYAYNATDSQNNLDEDDSSDLTHGSKQVICGNPVRALLARRKELKGDFKLKFDRSSPETPSTKFVPEHSYHTSDDNEHTDRDAIFEELRRWRDNFEKSSKELATTESKATDVAVKETRLTISPTPPSGNPSRASRRKLLNHTENQRPQTAGDFRPLATGSFGKVKKMQELSKSVVIGDCKQMSDEGVEAFVNRVTPVKEDVAVSSQSEVKRQAEFQGRSKYFRPGTAAAAYKKRSQKHFT